MLESCSVVIYDGSLILYSESWAERSEPKLTLNIGTNAKYEYNSKPSYGAAEVVFGGTAGSYKDPSNTYGSPVLYRRLPFHASGAEEANRFAKGILRDANKNARTGYFHSALLGGMAAGSVIDLKTTGAESWDGPVFIHHIRHDYANMTSKLFFRVPLEGY
jgi:hypothetical protein